MEECMVGIVMTSATTRSEVWPGGFDYLGNELGHGQFDMKLDKICKRVKLDVSDTTISWWTIYGSFNVQKGITQ
jgi:hypothetical protein